MDDVKGEPSRLFQDLVNLEKDFKYNLSLLKIKDSEIERCSSANKMLQEALIAKLSEIGGLSIKLSNVEEALQKSEHARKGEHQIYQQTVAKMTHSLNELTQKYRKELLDSKSDAKQQLEELEGFYSGLLKQKETEYEKNIESAEERIAKEMSSTSKAREGVQAVIDENMSLRNRIRQLESQYTSETYFYKNECNTVKSANANLNSEIEYLKENQASLKMKFDEIKLENDKLLKELRTITEKTNNLIIQNKETHFENKKLKEQIEQDETLYRKLILENDRIINEKKQLESEYGDVKRQTEEYSNKSGCTIDKHNDYDVLVIQNAVLQDLVRSMRKERERSNAANQDAERRLKKLEGVMKLIQNGPIQHCERSYSNETLVESLDDETSTSVGNF